MQEVLVFASNNAHKLEEVRRILAPREVLCLRDIGFVGDIEENGSTLSENSHIKARAVVDWLREQGKDNLAVFADDTGLEIEALNNAPGVITARWAGEPACDANNRKKALTELADKPNRNARFRTVVTLIRDNTEQQVEGEVRGSMATEERGSSGFGYDALFIPEGYDKTFGELPAELKNTISHRARALEKLKELLAK
ncbi:MAG: RdgB/HAM1 family non-canonical purine NTP pyrophosphatase [Paludibacteraceae bacterium]|nr:RdgB/HAM1 family non-canonical purine NTP pyrophosphatase [Paludibacteraceae bacterium]